jgi:O-antigen/teichoic acid export membrane protein
MLLLLLRRKGIRLKPDFSFLSKKMVQSIVRMSLYGIVMGFSGVMIFNIDSIMVSRMLGIEATGIYAITFFFGTLIIIPSRALRKIAGTVLADAWRNHQTEIIQSVYRKSSLNQFIAGSFLFVGLWANIHNVMHILPAPYQAGIYVIFFIALANLIEMLSGVSDILIQTSRDYRMGAFLNIIFLLMIVLFNYIFITLFGLTGAAAANALSFGLNSIFRYVFIYRKYGFHPFSVQHLYVLLIASISYLVGFLLPEIKPYPLDIFIRLFVVALIFGVQVYVFQISEDVNNTINYFLRKIKILK